MKEPVFLRWALVLTVYEVTDANGCYEKQGFSANGTIALPPRPDGINGPTSVSILEQTLDYSVENPDNSYTYTGLFRKMPLSLQGNTPGPLPYVGGSITGNVTVSASNECGESNPVSQK
jgi:hypothetical protein